MPLDAADLYDANVDGFWKPSSSCLRMDDHYQPGYCDFRRLGFDLEALSPLCKDFEMQESCMH